MLHAAQTSCLHDMFKLSASEHLTGAQVFVADLKPIDADMEDNFMFPDAKMPTPVFVGTGLADAAAGTTQQYNAVANLCAAGTLVEWHTYPGLSHNGAVNGSLRDSVPFVRRVLGEGAHYRDVCECGSGGAAGEAGGWGEVQRLVEPCRECRGARSGPQLHLHTTRAAQHR